MYVRLVDRSRRALKFDSPHARETKIRALYLLLVEICQCRHERPCVEAGKGVAKIEDGRVMCVAWKEEHKGTKTLRGENV